MTYRTCALCDWDTPATEPECRNCGTPAGQAPTDTVSGDGVDEGEHDDQRKRPSQATQLVEMARTKYTFAGDETGAPFAVARHGPNVARMLRGGRDSLRAELAHLYAAEHGRVPSASALTDATAVLEGEAVLAPRQPVALRVADHGKGVVLDLGDDTGRCVHIDPDGYRLLDKSPVTFRRTELTAALPAPEPGDVADLRDVINVSDEAWPALAAWLVSCFVPNVPHPILALFGQEGTAKSMTARALVAVTDPSSAPLRSTPRDLDQWAVAAAGSWVVALDNVSWMQAWLQDAICRAVTGEGNVKRALYTDGGLCVINFRRALILTSIDAGALRGDLTQRTLLVELDPIKPDAVRLDQEVQDAIAAATPGVFGGLCDLTASVLAVLPDVTLDTMPRMADYAQVLRAVDILWNTDGLGYYLDSMVHLDRDIVEGDQFAAAVLAFANLKGSWKGTASDLLELLTPAPPEKPPKGWPSTARALGGHLRRIARALASQGIDVTFARSEGARTVTVEATP